MVISRPKELPKCIVIVCIMLFLLIESSEGGISVIESAVDKGAGTCRFIELTFVFGMKQVVYLYVNV